MVAYKVKVDQYFNIDIFTDISKPGEYGASPLHYAARFRTNTERGVVAPVTTALSTDSFGGDDNPSYGMQVSGTNFVSGLLVLLTVFTFV